MHEKLRDVSTLVANLVLAITYTKEVSEQITLCQIVKPSDASCAIRIL